MEIFYVLTKYVQSRLLQYTHETPANMAVSKSVTERQTDSPSQIRWQKYHVKIVTHKNVSVFQTQGKTQSLLCTLHTLSCFCFCLLFLFITEFFDLCKYIETLNVELAKKHWLICIHIKSDAFCFSCYRQILKTLWQMEPFLNMSYSFFAVNYSAGWLSKCYKIYMSRKV